LPEFTFAGRAPGESVTQSIFAIPPFCCVGALLHPHNDRDEGGKPPNCVDDISDCMSVCIRKTLRSLEGRECGLVDESGYTEPALQRISTLSRPTNWIGNSHENKVVVDSPVTLSPFGVDCYCDASSEEDDEGLYGMNAILCSLIIPSCRCHTRARAADENANQAMQLELRERRPRSMVSRRATHV